MQYDRSKNAKRNMISGMINKFCTLLLPFLIRTIIIKQLGAEYLGLSSLFTSVLQVLNMAELGFSSAVVFSLYKPIAEGNSKDVCALLSFYRNVYRVIGTVITVGGVILLPFLPNLISGNYPPDINIYILYLIYLANTSISYFAFAYKNVLLVATQRQDLISNVDSMLSLIRYSVQALSLVIWRNYYAYIIWNIVFTVLNNFVVAIITKRVYPQYFCKGKIEEKEKAAIAKQIKGLTVGRISLVARNSFDSIVLSMFCGLIDVAIYSNYYYIFSAIGGFLSVIILSMSAGIGNSIAIEDKEKNYYDFKRFNFIYNWLFSFCTVCLYCLYQPFMYIWAGEKLTASRIIMVMFCIYFYISHMGQIRGMYASGAGLWWEFKNYEIGEIFANLLLNFLLGYYLGMAGILIATIITVTIFSLIGITHVTYKCYFKRSSMDYWRDNCFFIITTIVVCHITNYVSNIIIVISWSTLILRAFICALFSSCLLFIFTMMSKRNRIYLKSVVSNILN